MSNQAGSLGLSLSKWLLVAILACGCLFVGLRFFNDDINSTAEVAPSRSTSRVINSATVEKKDSGNSVVKKAAGKSNGNGKGDASDKKVAKDAKSLSKKLKSARAKVKKDDLEVLQKGHRSSSKFNNRSLAEEKTAEYRLELLAKAVEIALNSEDSWRNMISIALEFNRFGEKQRAQDVLRKAEQMALNLSDPEQSAKDLLLVVKAMLSIKDRASAQNTMKNIHDPAVYQNAVSEIAIWSAQHGDLDMARSLIYRISMAKDRDTALAALAKSEAFYQETENAMQTALSVIDTKKKNTALMNVALEFAKKRDYTHAAIAIQQISDQKLIDKAHTSIAKLKARAGDLEGSLNAIQYLKDPAAVDVSLRDLSRELAVQGMFSNSAYVSNRISSENEKSQALEKLSLEQAKKGDLSGSLIRTGTIPLDHVRERALTSLSSITAYKETPGQARNIARTIQSGLLRDRAFKAIAKQSARAGNHAEAFNTLQEISRPDEKALALIEVAVVQQNSGEYTKAASLMDDSQEMTVYVQSQNIQDKIMSETAVFYANSGESDRSFSAAGAMNSQSQKDKTYQKISKIFLKSDLELAQESMHAIQSDKLKLQTSDLIAKFWAKDVAVDDAVANLRVLENDRQKIVFLLEVSRLL